jgi:hypothetical protein
MRTLSAAVFAATLFLLHPAQSEAVAYLAGRSESHVEETVQPIYSRWRDAVPPISTTILASPGQVELHLTLRDTDAVRGAATIARFR